MKTMTFQEAREYAALVSEYHSLDIEIPGVARFLISDNLEDDIVQVNFPYEDKEYGMQDCWCYPLVPVVMNAESFAYMDVEIIGIGEDIVLGKFI